MHNVKHDEIRQAVRENYGPVDRADSGCGPACCTPAELPAVDILSRGIGYSGRVIGVDMTPEEACRDLALYAGCIAGAVTDASGGRLRKYSYAGKGCQSRIHPSTCCSTTPTANRWKDSSGCGTRFAPGSFRNSNGGSRSRGHLWLSAINGVSI